MVRNETFFKNKRFLRESLQLIKFDLIENNVASGPSVNGRVLTEEERSQIHDRATHQSIDKELLPINDGKNLNYSILDYPQMLNFLARLEDIVIVLHNRSSHRIKHLMKQLPFFVGLDFF